MRKLDTNITGEQACWIKYKKEKKSTHAINGLLALFPFDRVNYRADFIK